jgi:hypothetical protein
METKPVSVKGWIGSGARPARRPVIFAVIALPVLAGCSSSSSVDYAAEAYPSQSLVDLLRRPKESPPPAPSAEFPPAATAAAAPPLPASAAPPAPEPAPVAATAAASVPRVPATPPEEADPVAAAYPSVSLIDLLTGARKPAP